MKKTLPQLLAVLFLLAANLPADDERPSTLHLDDATIYANGNIIRMSGVPITTPDNHVKYLDITCKLLAAADGTIHMQSLTTAPTLRLANDTAAFAPGTYADNWNAHYTLSGPAAAPGGRIIWTLRKETNREKYEIVLTSGPALGHPALPNIVADNHFPAGYTFGHLNWVIPNAKNETNVVAMQQVKDTLTIAVVDLGPTKDDPHLAAPTVLHRVED